MRIYLGNKEIAGYFTHLKAGFDQLGIKSDLWDLMGNPYFSIKAGPAVQMTQWLFRTFKKCKSSIILLPFLVPVAIGLGMMQGAILLYALVRYDVFILNAQPFFNYSELAILRLFRKRVIFVFLGTESRPAYLGGNVITGKYLGKGKSGLQRCYRDAVRQKRMIERIEKYAHAFINHPPTAQFHERPFIAWLHVGYPNMTSPVEIRQPVLQHAPLKILHAPTNSISKGSALIAAMVSELSSENPVELLKVEKVPNEVVLQSIVASDLIVDEVFSDIPIGGLGTEAAIAGRAVLNGGYYATHIQDDYPPEVIPPARFCLPVDMADELKRLIEDPDLRTKCGEELQDFVANQWSSVEVAKRYLRIIASDIPENWIYTPERNTYFHGYGIEAGKLKIFLRDYLAIHGSTGLLLEDKPELRDRIVNFAKS